MQLKNKTFPMSTGAARVFDQTLRENHVFVDKAFSLLLAVQWLFGIGCAALLSPLSWSGGSSVIHLHVWSAIILGGLITGLPVILVLLAPGHQITRLTISASQLMFSALLIHLLGGRIEAHFHIFVSLALLAAYRDQIIFLPAVLITVFDHVVRGSVWPQSVFGDYAIVSWRPYEHGAWVIFETIALCFLIRQSLNQTATVAELQCSLEGHRDELQTKVAERTRELNDAKTFQDRILDSIDAQICILDAAGTILFANQSWTDFASIHGEPLVTTGAEANYTSIFDQDRGLYSECSKNIATGIRDVRDGIINSYAGEYFCQREDSCRWFQVRVNSVVMRNVRAISPVHIDVTAAKRAKNRAASLAQMVLDSPDEVYIVSLDTFKFVEVNYGACQNLGYDRETLLTMSPTDIQSEFSEIELQEIVQQLTSGKVSQLSFATLHRRKNGSVYRCRINVHSSVLDDENVLVAFVTDITEQKRLEEQLTQAQKLESVGQLAAGVAHEINTPMQCVFGNVEFLQTSFERLMVLSDHVVTLLEKSEMDWSEERNVITELRDKFKYNYLRQQTPIAIQEAADASTKVISIIRAMKIMSHPGSTVKTPIDLHEMIRNAAMITRGRWKYVATTEFDFDPKLHVVDVLSAEISQVFINLIVNAADSIGEKLGHEPAELGKITIATRIDNDWVRVTISDTGAGIPESVRHRIFDPFYTTKDIGKGTGQGLSISHNVIVNLHSGTIDVESVEGIGTAFVIRIPRYSVPIETEQGRSKQASRGMSPVNVNVPAGLPAVSSS